MEESYYEKYSFTQDYIEASAKKYQNKPRKELDFIQFDSHSLRECVSDLSDHYKDALKKYNKELEKHYAEMSFYFETGYNSILVAGYGSKYDFLNKFTSTYLSSYPIIAVNGFINGLTVKYILNKLVDFLKKNTSAKHSTRMEEEDEEKKTTKQTLNIEAQLHYIRSILDDEDSGLKYDKIVILIHSIDGRSIRNLEVQNVLSTIASMKRVTLIASMDHYLYQSLLSPQILANFNFRVFYVDTYAPYEREFQYLEEMNFKGNRKGADALKYILRSFTTNQKEIVKTLAKHLLDNPSLAGVEFKQLFKLCFDHAMISSESQLKENLLEVLDHKIIKETKGEKGRILYTMEFPRSLLEQIVEDKFE